MVAGASPALVSSLLIRSDQLRRSMFGFRSARSTLASQWSILRFVVQLSYRPSFATLRFAALSPSRVMTAPTSSVHLMSERPETSVITLDGPQLSPGPMR